MAGGRIEIRFGGRLHAIGQVAVIDFVQIEFQDLVLAVAAFDFGRQDGLAHFAQVGLLAAFLGRQQQGPRQLLGDGRSARDGFSAG